MLAWIGIIIGIDIVHEAAVSFLPVSFNLDFLRPLTMSNIVPFLYRVTWFFSNEN